ncbi:MAG: hypothetical protein GYA45_11795 [Pelolinea sp.]|nr:hypothetical protein [Pelolinea sp.]
MDPIDATSTIPMTAWEQAAIVALFAVVFIALIGLLLKWFSRQQSSWQGFMKEQNDSWQNSVEAQNESWQKWLADQNARECASMDKVTEALDKLSGKIDAHDNRVEERINGAVESLRARKAAK